MSISVFYHHVLQAAEQSEKPVAEILEAISKAGVSGVEMDLYNFSDEIDHTALIHSAGIKCECVNAHYSMETEFDEKQAQAHIDAAIACGSYRILVVPGYLSVEEEISLGKVIHDKKAVYSFLEACPTAVKIAEGLNRITQMAHEKGVTVTIEDFDNTASPLSGLNALLWYFDKVPHLKCTFDTGNFVTYGDDLFDAWNQLKDRIVHIHCKDRSDFPIAVGDGYLPLSELFQTIVQSGYNGAFAIEHYGAVDQLTCIMRSAGFIAQATV